MERLRFKDENGKKFSDWESFLLKDITKYIKSYYKEGGLHKIPTKTCLYRLYSPRGVVGYTSSYLCKSNYLGIIKWGSGTGKTFLFDEKTSVVWTMGALLSKENSDIRFIYYRLNYKFFHKYINTSTTPNLYYKDFSTGKIRIPILREQEKIGGFLSAIDRLVDKQKEKIDALKEMKKGYLQDIFPKKGKSVPKLRFKGFTDDWELRKLGDMAESFEYGLNASAMEYDGINKYLRITDIDEDTRLFKTDDLTSPNIDYNESDNYLLKKGDILFARTGASVGKSYIYKDTDGKVYFAGFLIRARIKSNYSPQFIYQTTLRDEYSKKIMITSQRSGQPGVNAKEYSSFEFMIPSHDEQVKIGEYFEKIDNLITLHQHKLGTYELMKKGYMQRLFA